MEGDIRAQIQLAEDKMAKYEPNSEPYLMYKEIRDSLAMKLPRKLHVAEEAVCDSCQ